MPRENFSDAVLVLLGHGSSKNLESSAAVFQHATELRRRRLFAEVREAFWKQDPQIQRVLAEISDRKAFIVPLFMSEGYFSDQVVPATLGFQWTSSHPRLQKMDYCRPVGTHERMTAVLLARARGIVAQHPFPRPPQPQDTTLFVAGHGTDKNENSRKAVERHVEQIRAKNEYAAVHAVFLEEEPRVETCYELAQTKPMIVVPFFMGDGMHVREDIPRLLGEPEQLVRQRILNGTPVWRNPTERKGHLVWYAPPAGTAPELADVILDRVRECAAGP